MTLSGVKPGDIVRVAGAHGIVVAKEPGRLRMRWVGANGPRAEQGRWVKASEVEAHWRKRFPPALL